MLIEYTMNQSECITAPKANVTTPYGVFNKPFVVGALYINKMERGRHSLNSSGIYQIQSIVNGKIYIGSASRFRDRRDDHFKKLRDKNHGSYLLQRHCDKYGIEDLIFKIIEVIIRKQDESVLDFRNKLLEREQYYIDTLKPEFNVCKIVNSCLGVIRSEEFKQKHCGENNVSKRPEVKQKQSEARKKYWNMHEHPFGEKNPFYKKKHSKNTCNIIGEKNKKHMKGNQYAKGNTFKHTPEQLQKMNDWWTLERREEWREKGKQKFKSGKLTYLTFKGLHHSDTTKKKKEITAN